MDKIVCEFCNKEIDSKEIITLKAFKKGFLGFEGEPQIWDSTICTDCYLNMRERIAKKEMNLSKNSYSIYRINT